MTNIELRIIVNTKNKKIITKIINNKNYYEILNIIKKYGKQKLYYCVDGKVIDIYLLPEGDN